MPNWAAATPGSITNSWGKPRAEALINSGKSRPQLLLELEDSEEEELTEAELDELSDDEETDRELSELDERLDEIELDDISIFPQS